MSGQSLERAVHAEFQKTKAKFYEFDKAWTMKTFRLKREQANKLLHIIDHDSRVQKMFDDMLMKQKQGKFLDPNEPQKFLHDFHTYMQAQIRDSDKEWSWTKFRPVTTYDARIAKIENDAKTKMPQWRKNTEWMENLMSGDTAAPETIFPAKKARHIYRED